ncbi:hypothetical protein [Halpernia sp.]|uniref:hypothetical protein n=1 Tax=Halpernia sp. TaxID=2782209 RepID=UPI003A8DFD97
MKLFIYSVLILSVLSCSKKEESQIKKLDVPDSLITSNDSNFNIEKIPENCYLQVIGKDSTAVHIIDNLGTFSGKMAVRNSEKDSSFGDLSGFKNGDTLQLTYTFQSEGVTSETPIYFIEKNDELIQGFGDFNDTKSLKFDAKNAFKKVNCNQINNLLK